MFVALHLDGHITDAGWNRTQRQEDGVLMDRLERIGAVDGLGTFVDEPDYHGVVKGLHDSCLFLERDGNPRVAADDEDGRNGCGRRR